MADILIAEDSPTQAAQVKFLLESFHYKVVVTQNGQQALDWLSDHKPSLVISDIVMPEMNGFELCEKIKSCEHTEDIPVILLTSLSDPNEVIEGLSCGADSFITKPYNKEALITNIEKILIEKAAPASKEDKLGIEINYDGKKRLVRAEPQKLVKLLLNIYQGAIHQNTELNKTKDELKLLNESLEDIVEQRTEKLIIANKELVFQNGEKAKRAEELILANNELYFQNEEKEKRAAELIIANKELVFQNEEKEKRAAELIIANRELFFQNEEKEKRAAELVKAKEKAEESDNLKSAFLNNLSHEIRTPMNQILGFAGFLNDPELTETHRDEYVVIINSQSQQLLHIINDIVEISKITAGQVDLKSTSFNLSVMMDELFAIFKPKAERRNLHLGLNKKITDGEAMIQGDQVKLKQIFSNLIENAIKFTDSGSIDIDYSRVGDRLIVAVKDTGIGIEEQEKKVIFDQFRQVEITLMRKYGGLGLGLSISLAYARMMSGLIRFESELGVGSTFFVEIPFLPAIDVVVNAKKDLPILDFSRPDWNNKTILIAEDEESNVDFLRAALKSSGINILIADNGLKAVEQCKLHPEIDLVLMDIKMPRMDGIEATRIIKSIRCELPVIAITAYAMTNDKEHFLAAGFDDYLPKPFKREDLIAKIQNSFKPIHSPALTS